MIYLEEAWDGGRSKAQQKGGLIHRKKKNRDM